MTRKNSLLFLFLLIVDCCFAQKFNYSASLIPVENDGFYQLVLSPEIRAKAAIDLSDIRIKDEEGKFVPYVFEEHSYELNTTFKEMPIIAQHTENGKSVFVINTKNEADLNHLDIVLNNNAVSRKLNISGSNDAQNWFAILDSFNLSAYPSNEQTVHSQTIPFPKVHYAYLKLEIDNQRQQPLAILKIGSMETKEILTSPLFSETPIQLQNQIDSSDGNSYYYLTQSATYPINKLAFRFEEQRYYNRTLKIWALYGAKPNRETFLSSNDISGKNVVVKGQQKISELILQTPCNALQLLLVIPNGDNPPLPLKAVQAFHYTQAVIPYLKKGKHYSLCLGNAQLAKPQYELNSFRDSIPKKLPEVKYGNIQKLLQSFPNNPSPKQPKPYLLWLSLIFGMTVLGFFTFKMMKEVNERK